MAPRKKRSFRHGPSVAGKKKWPVKKFKPRAPAMPYLSRQRRADWQKTDKNHRNKLNSYWRDQMGAGGVRYHGSGMINKTRARNAYSGMRRAGWSPEYQANADHGMVRFDRKMNAARRAAGLSWPKVKKTYKNMPTRMPVYGEAHAKKHGWRASDQAVMDKHMGLFDRKMAAAARWKRYTGSR